MSRRNHRVVAWDLGKRADYSAASVIERVGRGEEAVYHLRYLRRVPRGTSYVQVEEQVIDLYNRVSELGTADLVLDRGGVGDAVIDAVRLKGLDAIAVVVTGGEKTSELRLRGRRELHIPKAKLYINLAVAVERPGVFLIAEGLKYGGIFRAELERLRYRRTASGGLVFANEEGAHDDLISSVSMGYLYAERHLRKAEINFRWVN